MIKIVSTRSPVLLNAYCRCRERALEMCECFHGLEEPVKKINFFIRKERATQQSLEWICQEMNVESYWFQNIFVSYPFTHRNDKLAESNFEDKKGIFMTKATEKIFTRVHHPDSEKKSVNFSERSIANLWLGFQKKIFSSCQSMLLERRRLSVNSVHVIYPEIFSRLPT